MESHEKEDKTASNQPDTDQNNCNSKHLEHDVQEKGDTVIPVYPPTTGENVDQKDMLSVPRTRRMFSVVSVVSVMHNPHNRARKLGKVLWKMLSSQVGLIVVLLCYAFAGAAMFETIEGGNEEDHRNETRVIHMELLEDAWESANNLTKDEFVEKFHSRIHAYQMDLYAGFQHGIKAGDDGKIWDYWGSMLFCCTVFTTIGYGHITPVTRGGRVATMLYAAIGVPLFLVVMANCGKLLTTLIKFLWSSIRRVYYTNCCRKLRKSNSMKRVKEKLSFKRSLEPADTDNPDNVDANSFVDYEVNEEFNINPLVAITITFVYIFLGAVMYNFWEPWTYLESFYFIFISVSTIGFGDLVPMHPKFFLLSSIYILFGLSLVAMVINVLMVFFNLKIKQAQEKLANVGRHFAEDIEHSRQDVKPGMMSHGINMVHKSVFTNAAFESTSPDKQNVTWSCKNKQEGENENKKDTTGNPTIVVSDDSGGSKQMNVKSNQNSVKGDPAKNSCSKSMDVGKTESHTKETDS